MMWIGHHYSPSNNKTRGRNFKTADSICKCIQQKKTVHVFSKSIYWNNYYFFMMLQHFKLWFRKWTIVHIIGKLTQCTYTRGRSRICLGGGHTSRVVTVQSVKCETQLSRGDLLPPRKFWGKKALLDWIWWLLLLKFANYLFELNIATEQNLLIYWWQLKISEGECGTPPPILPQIGHWSPIAFTSCDKTMMSPSLIQWNLCHLLKISLLSHR